MSIKLNQNIDSDGLEAVPFTIDIKNTPFKFNKYLSGLLLYSDPVNDSIKPMFVIGAVSKNFTENDQKSIFMNHFYEVSTYNQQKNYKSRSVKINSLNGYEIIGYEDNDSKMLLYLVVLFQPKNNLYFIFNGLADDNTKYYLKQYKKIIKTFKLKQCE